MRDTLTGLYNREALFGFTAREIKHAERTKRPLAVLLIDVDNLKLLNDAHGWQVGDEYLCALAELFRGHQRGDEILARYGNDEFAVILPETDAAGSMACAERMRRSVEEFDFRADKTAKGAGKPRLTVSIGVAVFPEDGAIARRLFSCSEDRLSAGKRGGKNRVTGPLSEVERRKQPRIVLDATMTLRRQSESMDIASRKAMVNNISIAGALATVANPGDLKPEEQIFFSIRIPSRHHPNFPVSHLIGSGKIQRVSSAPEPNGSSQVSVVFGEELVMVASA